MTELSNRSKMYIASELGPNALAELTCFLRSGESGFTAGRPDSERACDSLMLWGTRAKNATLTGVRIEGIRELVKALRGLDSNAELDRYNYQKGRALLTLYRDAANKRPVGYLFVNTPRPQDSVLEARLGIHRAENGTAKLPKGRKATGAAVKMKKVRMGDG
jgi:hypothetical protein